jgi:phthiocerol/phenolphthiocerol synthesis type-I polyketide synthase E
MSSPADGMDAIAIIGMACRFPGANSPEVFWRNIREGMESIRFFSEEELRAAGVPEADLRDPSYVRAAPLIDRAEHFDAALFGLSPAEARTTDPQQRVFLECSWEAFENAGYHPGGFSGSIGVFAGCSMNTYFLHLLARDRKLIETQSLLQAMIGNEKDFLATRVAYLLNLRGPAITVQTACSTSLVAVHLACQSLWNYECDMALAGGSTVRAPRTAGYRHVEGNIYSSDGHCRAFDERGSGTIFGEGAGVVLLKRFEDAQRDGDSIAALIRGIAINNDGSRKAGFTAPSVEGQAEVIAAALTMAGVPVETIGLVEAHGTATQLGDSVEVAALTHVFGGLRNEAARCALGSVKTNFGHLDAAAGIAGLIKAALALKNGEIPKSLHYTRPNPHLGLERSPFYVPVATVPWPNVLDREGRLLPRRAGVSSFGVGGTNAHAILEEAQRGQTANLSRNRPGLFVLSARTPEALRTSARNLCGALSAHDAGSVDDVAFTLQVGRRELDYRCSVVAGDFRRAAEALADSELHVHQSARDAVRPVFMFPGQGSQYPAMARELYREQRGFRDRIDACAELLRPVLDTDIRVFLLPEPQDEGSCAELMTQTTWAQPALFCVEYSLAMLFRDWGISPAAMIGHSIGEYAAAVVAGVFSFEDAVRLVALRGRIMQEQPPGSLAVVELAEGEAQRYLEDGLEIALVNSPSHCVIGGPSDKIEMMQSRLRTDGIKSRVLRASHAFHTWLMDGARDQLLAAVASVDRQSPRIPFVSNLTGTWITDAQACDPLYWAEQMRRTVRFSQGVQTLLAGGHRLFLEVGPGTTLGTLLEYNAGTGEALAVPTLQQGGRSACETVLEAVGTLWGLGIHVQWGELHHGESCHRVALPTYPFEGQRFWYDDQDEGPERAEPRSETAPDQVPSVAGTLPRDHVYSTLMEIWKELLGVQNIGPDDDFFRLGGTSLMAVQLSSRIKQQFGGRLPLKIILQAPTIAHLTTRILAGSHDESNPMPVESRPRISNGSTESAGSPGFQGEMDPMQAQTLLNKLDELTDEEIERALRDLAAKEGKG